MEAVRGTPSRMVHRAFSVRDIDAGGLLALGMMDQQGCHMYGMVGPGIDEADGATPFRS